MNGVGAAQFTVGVGPLTSIVGTLNGVADIADIYMIHITNESQFLATVASQSFDSELWLFNMDGSLQVYNDDQDPNHLSANSTKARITSQGVFTNGYYFLAISQHNATPIDVPSMTALFYGVWPGPDVIQGAGDPSLFLGGWYQNVFATPGGSYTISLAGAEFAPTPGTAALLGLGCLTGLRRRR